MSSLDALLRTLTKIAAVLELSDRIRARSATWIVPVAAICVAGWMFHEARQIALAPLMMSPTIYQISNAPDPGGPSEVLFWCDWRNALDSTSTAAALRTCVNAGDLQASGGNGIVNLYVVDSSVVELTGRGWPAAKALKVFNNNSTAGYQVLALGDSAPWSSWDTTNVGESLYFRYYELINVPDSVGNNGIHGIEAPDGNSPLVPGTWTASGAWTTHHFSTQDSTGHGMDLGLWTGNGTYQSTWDLEAQNRRQLPKDTVIRVEWQLRRTDIDSITAHVRLYVWNGSTFVLRYSDGDFVKRFGGGITLADSAKEDWPSDGFNPGSPATNAIQIGTNDWDTALAGGYPFMFVGGFAICRDTWCGDYPIAGVEN